MSEGLLRLTEYLNQTRRQAEIAIDVLNSKISDLNTENEKLREEATALGIERDNLRQENENLKVENPKKWRFQERDDWKALVESVQKDRSRLQEECARLELSLEEAKEQISRLEEETIYLSDALKKYRSMDNQLQTEQTANGAEVVGEESLSHFEDSSFETRRSNLSITIDSCFEDDMIAYSGSSPPSPRVLTRKLQLELDQANAQMEVDKRIAAAEKSAYENEIKQLRQDLESMQIRLRSTLTNGTEIESRSNGSIPTRSIAASRDRPEANVVVPKSMFAPTIQPRRQLSWFDRLGQMVAPYPAPVHAQKSPTSIEHV